MTEPWQEIEMVTVHYYDCDCPWQTKYCDDHHRKVARIPRSVLERWTR